MTAPYHRIALVLALPLAAHFLACNTVGTGDVQVFVEAEDTIPEGLTPGGDEGLADGWTVKYETFLVTVGNFRAELDDNTADLVAPEIYVVDMLSLPAGGFVIAEFEDVEATRWQRVGYDIANADANSEPATGVDDAELQLMVDNGYSVYFEATLSKSDGQSCLRGDSSACEPAPELKIAWGLAAGTSFDDCAPEEGDAGFAVPTGGVAQVKPTIHGDHWFFTNITQGAEITERRAQWIADCDLDRDGEVTLEELKQVSAAEVFPAAVYSTSGAIIPVTTAFDYLEAQARTLGDFQGEGECPTRSPL